MSAPLESATGSVDGVVGTTSTSSSGFSVVTVELVPAVVVGMLGAILVRVYRRDVGAAVIRRR